MRIVRSIVVGGVTGIMVGSTITLCLIALGNSMPTLTQSYIIENFIMYALIGILTSIFNIESLPYAVMIGIHMLGTLAIVLGSSLIFGWGWLSPNHGMMFLVIFISIYVCVWIGVYINSRITSNRINQRLKERNKNN